MKKETIESKVRELCNLKPVPQALPLPVKYDGVTYIWGKDMEMVADCHMEDFFRIRGAGRLSYKENGEELQDECANYIADAINAYPEIQLQHVLMAVHDKVRVTNVFEDNQLTLYTGNLEAKYNLSLPFSDQSQELFDFLGEVLNI